MATAPPLVSPLDEPGLTYRRVSRFYLPLALSWLFMAIESPIAISVISRLPNATVNTAAFFAVISLALFIESPIIDLLATSTTLAKNRASFLALTRFTLWLMALVTLAHLAIAFTPLFDVVANQALELPAPVSKATLMGMTLMVPWSACIGWRRYLQGVLIRNSETRKIGFGTGVRVLTMATGCYGLYLFTNLPSIEIVAISLASSVAAEALFIHFVSRPVVRRQFHVASAKDDQSQPLTTRKLLAFHLPLTATTVVTMATFPITAAAIDRSINPTLMLASWQVAVSLLFLMRTIVYALPEVVITLAKDDSSQRRMRDFCLWVGALTSGALILMAVLNLDYLFFRHLLGAKPEESAMAHIAFYVGATTPFLGALQSYIRGMLTARHLTAARLWSILVGVTALIGSLALGVSLQWLGVVTASLAITFAMLAELITLYVFWNKSEKRRNVM